MVGTGWTSSENANVDFNMHENKMYLGVEVQVTQPFNTSEWHVHLCTVFAFISDNSKYDIQSLFDIF